MDIHIQYNFIDIYDFELREKRTESFRLNKIYDKYLIFIFCKKVVDIGAVFEPRHRLLES